ncbi:hypothetical protein N9Y26_00830 [bacterium]|nr:hypothetical protein [bacterium]MDB2651824.1 hypothetical protein [bacterium]
MKLQGLVTMLYGLDKRTNTYDVETDLGTARQALTLIERGKKPIIFERGKDVRGRRRDIAWL